MNPMQRIKQQVCDANRSLPDAGLVVLTWGNVSALDRESRRMVIKPSGVCYPDLTADSMVVVALDTGQCEAPHGPSPSSDTPTHLELYRAFPDIGGVVHTHSVYATAWAQALRPIPCLGTTHADTFNGPVPLCRPLSAAEVAGEYERNVGRIVVEHFHEHNLDPRTTPGVLAPGHGPFAWGKDAADAVHNAIVLEEVARMACITLQIDPEGALLPEHVLRKHFDRKHGPDAYYGQGG